MMDVENEATPSCEDDFIVLLEKTWSRVSNMWPKGSPRETSEISSFIPNQFINKKVLDSSFKASIVNCLYDWVLDLYRYDLETVVLQKFWAEFNADRDYTFFKFPCAVACLHNDVHVYLSFADQIESSEIIRIALEQMPSQKRHVRSLKKEMFTILRSVMYTEPQQDFWQTLNDYYANAFKVYYGRWKGPSRIARVEDRMTCTGCEQKPRSCCCDDMMTMFIATNSKIWELQLNDNCIGRIPIHLAQEDVESYIRELCVKKYEVSFLPILKGWMQDVPMKWLADIFFITEKSLEDERTKFNEYQERLLHTMYCAYAEIRLDQLFNIIIEFPDSRAAVEDLRECMEVTDIRLKLVKELKTTIKRRLLHPGVNTADILTAYISCIKALRILDPSSVILQLVGEPISKYLRSRDDTVRCIVSSLTDDTCEDLASELVKNAPLVLQDDYMSDEENVDWKSWKPDPIDADPSRAAKAQRSSDIISMLVNIYGTKEVFVNEYRTLLADRLLNSFSFNTKKELRYLELLKLRFGESQMHYCDVMLKDIADSKRINTRLNSEDVKEIKDQDFPINAMILSAQFWPPFKEEKFKLPDYIWHHLEMYTSSFEALKGNRTLVWKPHLGQINIEIELKNKKLELSVSPIHATILWHFQERSEWTIEELSSKMQIQASVLRRKITYWQSHGILKEREPDVFALVEEHKGASQESVVVIEEEMESVAASSHDQREEELQTFWSYIVGMLTNMESLSLERIHSMLRMFAMQGTNTNEFTLQGMKQFLDNKVKERKLVYSGGLYRLPRGE